MATHTRAGAWLIYFGTALAAGGCRDPSDHQAIGDEGEVEAASALAVRVDFGTSPPPAGPAHADRAAGTMEPTLQASHVAIAQSRRRTEDLHVAPRAFDEAPMDQPATTAPALHTTLLSCPALPGSPFTDCACPDGSTVVGGGGYAPERLVLKESRPVNATAWRLACQTMEGVQVACAIDAPGSVWVVCAQVN